MAQLSVTGTASTLVDATGTNSPCNYVLINQGSAIVYLASAFDGIKTGVTTSTGCGLLPGAMLYGSLSAGDALYGITAGSTVTVHRLRTFR